MAWGRRTLRVIIFALFVSAAANALQILPAEIVTGRRPGQVAKSSEQICPGDREKTNEAKFRNYVVRTYRWPDPEGCFEVLLNGKQIYSEFGQEFQIGGSPEAPLMKKRNLLVPIGTDVTGLGEPNLVVGDWSGGAHCCFNFRVFELAERFRLVAKIKAENSGLAYFSDVDHDGRVEFVANDWTFAYWHASFADSPAPRIVLRFRDGAFHLAPELMRKPAPSAKQLATWARELNVPAKWENPDDPPSELWGVMLELINKGSAPLAWRYFETNWPKERKGKKEFLNEFRAKLRESPYFADLEELNGGKVW